MATWKLTNGLTNLRNQVNAAFPNRDKASDGTIGDAAHQAEISGHNPDDAAGATAEWNGDPDSTPEVRAWDMDSDLGQGVTAQQLVDHLRGLPGLSSVIRYMIYNRKMYHERDGFAPTVYTGASAHTEHVHFSGAWSQAADNNSIFDYQLGDLVPITSSDIDKIAEATANKTLKMDGVIQNAPGAGDYATNPEIALATGVQRVYDLEQRLYNADLPGAVAELAAKVDALTALVQELKAS